MKLEKRDKKIKEKVRIRKRVGQNSSYRKTMDIPPDMSALSFSCKEKPFDIHTLSKKGTYYFNTPNGGMCSNWSELS